MFVYMYYMLCSFVMIQRFNHFETTDTKNSHAFRVLYCVYAIHCDDMKSVLENLLKLIFYFLSWTNMTKKWWKKNHQYAIMCQIKQQRLWIHFIELNFVWRRRKNNREMKIDKMISIFSIQFCKMYRNLKFWINIMT